MSQQQKEISRLMISQTWLVSNIPFFLFLSGLAVIYIYNGHHAEKSIKDINKTSRELKSLQYEYKMIRSEWMFMTKQSEVVEAVKSMGLNEINEPPAALEKRESNHKQ
jgi:cell division protein FtsL